MSSAQKPGRRTCGSCPPKVVTRVPLLSQSLRDLRLASGGSDDNNLGLAGINLEASEVRGDRWSASVLKLAGAATAVMDLFMLTPSVLAQSIFTSSSGH